MDSLGDSETSCMHLASACRVQTVCQALGWWWSAVSLGLPPGSPEGRPAGDPWTVWAQHRSLLSGVQGRLISSSKGKGLAGWQGPGASLRGGVGLAWPPRG